MNYYIKADRFLVEDGEVLDSYLHVKAGCFGEFTTAVPKDATVQDWTGHTIAPGLFDTHIHGVAGHDVMDGKVESIHRISEALPAVGVTRFLPTTLTSSKPDLEKSIQSHTEAGSLAGSTLKLIDGVKNLQEWSKFSLSEVWHLGSLSPANSVGKGEKLGSISAGKYADYVVLNKNLEIEATAIEGEVKFENTL